MKKNIFWSILAFAIFSSSQAQGNLWKSTSEKEIGKSEKMNRSAVPMNYEIYNLDIKKLKNSLANTVADTDNISSKTVISFPTSGGKLERFEIYKAPVMEQGLADKFTEIMSYSGKSLDNPGSTIRFSVTLFGLHAVSYSAENGTTYIDTYTGDLKNYIVYNRTDLNPTKPFECLVNDEVTAVPAGLSPLPQQRLNNTGTFRQYRLAMACTVEYAKFHIDAARDAQIPVNTDAQQKAVVLSAMVATMTRVNYIFERDLSVRMNLIADNDKIIFITQDSFSNNDSNLLIGESQKVINQIITAANYDIGHTVSTGGGGLASLAVPCDDQAKARGITGSSNPVGDAYDVDFVAHEMGHQFGATHTFNQFCVDDQLSPITAVETGSGTSIMGYAGVCQPKADGSFVNVQATADPFFINVSIKQMMDFVSTNGTCSQNNSNTTAAPIADAGIDRIIPKNTPFKLVGSATGTSNTAEFTYSWEQNDNQITIQPPVSTAVKGPIFRNYAPSKSPARYVPAFEDVLLGISRKYEVLPTVPRTVNFNLLVRDNNAVRGGQTAVDGMKVITANVGPFTITYPFTGAESWQANTPQTVTWDIAGTTSNGINTTLVNILFSADNGQNFITLKENTPNDGNEAIIAPDYNSTNCRILIEPVGNIYYAVSKRFKVLGGSTASVDVFGLDDFRIYPNPTNDSFTVQFESESTNDITIAVHDLRGRLIANQSYKNTGHFQQEINLGQAQAGIYMVTVQDGNNKEVKKVIKK
ncbi:reprolysin-like metallopeptidase [Flavobacterium sp. JP2137]|uniref:zinc-dependent metalloprotease n=1 Tax=Flavobacterium sp. JP2137 TaxID=3414510 RepID=UPI003D2FD978